MKSEDDRMLNWWLLAVLALLAAALYGPRFASCGDDSTFNGWIVGDGAPITITSPDGNHWQETLPRSQDIMPVDTPIPLQIGITPNARGDNSLYCTFTPNWGQDCPGGWLGLYVDAAGYKHPDAHYADLRHAMAGEPDGFGHPTKPPGYPSFGHPKFRCYERCGTGGWAYGGWPGGR